MTEYSLEKIIRIYNDSNGAFIEITQHPDFPKHGLVIKTIGNNSEDYFGKIKLELCSKELVLNLIEALSEMAKQLKE